MSKFDNTKFQEDLQAIDLLDYPHLDTNDLASLFHKHFMKSYNLHAPIKIFSKKTSSFLTKYCQYRDLLKKVNKKK